CPSPGGPGHSTPGKQERERGRKAQAWRQKHPAPVRWWPLCQPETQAKAQGASCVQQALGSCPESHRPLPVLLEDLLTLHFSQLWFSTNLQERQEGGWGSAITNQSVPTVKEEHVGLSPTLHTLTAGGSTTSPAP
ncbi:hypothetical protein H1C71_035884, partial [Ictidomys tridecemlineatus]